jgi:6-pyruvoyltetrahydropterin/6-carboxytetrahydropterin synthase
MYSISKDFAFSASHQLSGLDECHPCSRLHGHNYIVRLTLRCEELNEVGFVYDYRNLDSFKQWIDDTVDHRDLNEVMASLGINSNPTAEAMARWFRAVAMEMIDLPRGCKISVSVSETPKTWATYEVTP